MDNINNITNIIIGTTAINRPILHKNVLPGWLKWISYLDKEKKITWFINIDIVEKLPFTYEETRKTIEDILSDLKLEERITVKFIGTSEKGNFFNACKRLSTNILEYVFNEKLDSKNVRIMWLEDDWKFNDDIIKLININYILNTFSFNRTHINLTFIRNNYIWALAPSIIDYELWVDIYYKAWVVQLSNIDPEHCTGLHYIKMYGRDKYVHNLTVICRPEKTKYLNNGFINYVNSLFTVIDECKNSALITHDRFVKKENFINRFGNKNIFIRLTPTFCIGGCNYGRDFMKEYDLEKMRKQNSEITDFYKTPE